MGQINTDECVILEVRQCTINVTSRFACATTVVVDKRIIITYSECVFVDLCIHHVMHMRSIVICGLSSCTICFSRRSFNHCCSRVNNNYYIFWVCVCRRRYPPCNAHAQSCHLWSFQLYNMFFTLSAPFS